MNPTGIPPQLIIEIAAKLGIELKESEIANLEPAIINNLLNLYEKDENYGEKITQFDQQQE